MQIKGRKALVFGGTSGIGLAVVQRLAEAGATVIALSRSSANIEAAQSVVPDSVRLASVDVLDREALAQVFADNAPFDILVNAATGGERALGPFLSMDLDGFQGSFRKLWGYTNTVRIGTEHMTEDGAIVLVSGSPARKCGPGAIALSTVGNAVEGFVRGVAPELAPRRINVVAPGVIDTPMFQMPADAKTAFFEQATSKNLIPRAGSANEVAQAIMFVITNDFVTGTTVDVDGGALLP
ncbi:MAG: SDR family oxidoreductase [Gammaproteobacteria bacterium]|nr:SDR family oxidoreductase [Gammaproteobacteria bacterium]